MGRFVEGFVNFNYKSNSWLHAGHFARSSPGWPKMKILPIVLHRGHMPVVTFFGPVLMIFWVFRRPIISKSNFVPFKRNFSLKRESPIIYSVKGDPGHWEWDTYIPRYFGRAGFPHSIVVNWYLKNRNYIVHFFKILIAFKDKNVFETWISQYRRTVP